MADAPFDLEGVTAGADACDPLKQIPVAIIEQGEGVWAWLQLTPIYGRAQHTASVAAIPDHSSCAAGWLGRD